MKFKDHKTYRAERNEYFQQWHVEILKDDWWVFSPILLFCGLFMFFFILFSILGICV